MDGTYWPERQCPPALRRGYINFYAVYIGWLCSAVFLHLPSFQALGIDVRTDLSVLLTIFLLSLLVRPARRRCPSPRMGSYTRGFVTQYTHPVPQALRSAQRCWVLVCTLATCLAVCWARPTALCLWGANRRSPSVLCRDL